MTENTDTLSPVLADLKAKAENATPGPWDFDPEWVSYHDNLRPEMVVSAIGPDRRIVASVDVWHHETPGTHENTAFIAAANPSVILSLLTALEEAQSGLHGVMEAGRQEIALLRARAEVAETALAEARRQIAERDEALNAMIAAFGPCRPKTAQQEDAFSQAMSAVLAAPVASAAPRLVTADVLKRSPAIEELTPVNWEWDACISVQDRYNLMKRKVDAAFALLSPPPTEGAGKEEGCLTREEQKAQAARCSCRGTDEWCVCQNSPDHITRKERADV